MFSFVGGGGYIFAIWPVFYFGKFSQPSKEKEKSQKAKKPTKKKKKRRCKRYKGFVFWEGENGPNSPYYEGKIFKFAIFKEKQVASNKLMANLYKRNPKVFYCQVPSVNVAKFG